MALADNASTALAKFANLSLARQLGVLVGLAASVAIGVAVVLWSREPNYTLLSSQVSSRDAAEMVNVLQRNGIAFKIDQNQGMLLVDSEQLQQARMKLAAEGLPKPDDATYDLFANSGAFSSSQFMESARYKKALETELARTISQFSDVKAARVHLAIPRESAFVRDSKEPSASIFIDVYSGRDIKKHTIAAIVNLVASSIPSLNASRVTVVDQNGMLLNEGGGNSLFTNTERYQDYRESLERQYADRIQDILTPMLGYGRVKAKVSADMDFTSYEQTQEHYNPDGTVLRSEQIMREREGVGASAGGIPGALSNTVPQQGAPASAGTAAQGATTQKQVSNNTSIGASNDYRLQSSKSFEVDKTISHTRNQPGTIKRLSVAVLVENHQITDSKTQTTVSKPLTPAEIKKIQDLISDAIGLNVKRGDSINILNSDFVKPDPILPLPEKHFWQTAWFLSVVKQFFGALFVLIIVFGLLKPLFKSLVGMKVQGGGSGAVGSGQEGVVPEIGYDPALSLAGATDYETQISLLRTIVNKEPKRVAQVVKGWVDRG